MLEWTKDLETGDSTIDQEHREIYGRLNALEAAIERGAEHDALRGLIHLLLDYTHKHFRHEEAVMRCRNCPTREANSNAHDEFLSRMIQWLAIMNTGPVPISVVADIQAETSQWIHRHIVQIDCGLRAVTTS